MNYEFYPKLVLRTPLIPLKTEYTENELKSFFQERDASEALFLASPDLHQTYTKWASGKLTNPDRSAKLVHSLYKYAVRMHSRCTPFGLFARCSTVDWGDTTTVTLNPKDLYRSTRLDMHFSCQLAQKIAQLKDIKRHLFFFPNSSLYFLKDKIRYVEYHYLNKQRKHEISAIDGSEYVQHILSLAERGATIENLTSGLAAFDDTLLNDEIAVFIDTLISEQILVSETEPSVSGDELLLQVLEVLNRIRKSGDSSPELTETIQFVEAVLADLKQIDQAVFNDITVYAKLEEKLSQFNINYEKSKLFQTDLFSRQSEQSEISKRDVQSKLRKALNVINRLTPRDKKIKNLSDFKEKFEEKYGEKEVPILIAADNEVGIGYGANTNHSGGNAPLVNGLYSGKISHNSSREIKWNNTHSILLQLLLEAKETGSHTIELKEEDLTLPSALWDDLPDTISVMFSLSNDHLILNSAGGSSATNLLGRFASGNEEIHTIVKDIARIEQELNPEKILAEIVHLPESRAGNILIRPSIRTHEIPYLSKSNLPYEQQLDLQDLYLSVKNGRLILRSKRLNKEVVPKMANAHNYRFMSLPVYQLLCDLQTNQNRRDVYFSWGPLEREFRFLPRVKVNDVVISLARWHLRKEDLKDLLDGKVKQWQEKWHIPDKFLLAEGDNELLINLENDLSRNVFVSMIKQRPHVTLKEFIFDNPRLITDQNTGDGFVNQLIAVLFKKNKTQETTHHFSGTEEPQRRFSLGSEWVYYKIYSGIKTSEKILVDVIKPMAERWLNAGLIDKWFFIRYADPDPHLRVRFRLKNQAAIGTVITEFGHVLEEDIKNDIIWKVQTAIYERELERYGLKTMDFAETVFYHDSQNCLDVLSLIDNGEEGQKIRWLYALRVIDEYFGNFGFSLHEKKELAEFLRRGFGQEFGMDKYMNKQLDKKFRADRQAIEKILTPGEDENNELLPLLKRLHSTSEEMKPVILKIRNILNEDGEQALSGKNLVSSFTHMFLNRFFSTKQRLHELVVYDFLWRVYRSRIARSEKGK